MIALPSIEAIEYGRRILTQDVERLRKFEADALARGDVEQSKNWQRMANWIEWRILGDGQGCVVTGFDPRYTEPSFRATLEEIER